MRASAHNRHRSVMRDFRVYQSQTFASDTLFRLANARIAKSTDRLEKGAAWVTPLDGNESLAPRYNFGTTEREKKRRTALSDTRQSTWSFHFHSSGPGGRRFKSSLPDQSFLESINYEHKKRDFGAEFGTSKPHLSIEFSIFNQPLSSHNEPLGDDQRIKSSDA